MKTRPQTPIAEALSAHRGRKGKSEEVITLHTPSNAEIRAWMDGKAEFPGLAGFSKTLRRLSIEAGEPQP